ncbi:MULTISPECIES: YhjD/YihY/BrkB family envelope integrity protein [Corynebacterium]|uniref:YihY family inner membrane protein n=1 Tax=Corynebacterium striatum TaxID=43770 RepID=A0ABX7DIQ8_CORST|nr:MULTISPECIES: YhjD/YihY/BrkB family envelope integrity protein [Corynebacterium]KAA1271420.1 YihY family inner membrane protein [Corynebacterium striatum]MDK8787995.1 YhjD/YihY/BrkB family envelope integrity protein [Corynebacterium striatum]MDK8880948.1 YhjD/YihY/BrkB family envelope integrity protein [Corynebacterium striatum]OFT66341.1 inner membrane protein YhjD [Corynebacterium sp. HMSC05D08]QQU77743.1 YihY family inner membrane protein [Corynebacterium striatum]
MATSTQTDQSKTDDYGIERAHADDPGPVDKVRERSPFVDHIMRMLGRYGEQGGNQFSAGITYFSVLAIFPLFMLAVAGAATVLATRPDLMQQVQDQIANSVSGDLGDTLNELLETAIAQRGAMYGIGGLTTLWSGLGWMNNLRIGISAMWDKDPNETQGNFFTQKLSDLLALIGLLVALLIAFGVTAAGSSGLTQKVFEWVGIESFPGMDAVLVLAGIVIGLVANFLVFWWMIVFLPRTDVPTKSGLKGAAIGAVAFEAIKQLSTVIMSSASGNPAGAVFGPVIVLMVVMYLIWRVVLYVSAWTATTEESMELAEPPVPEPAVIRVRNEVKSGPSTGVTLGAGAVLGAAAAGVAALLRRK